MQFNQNFDLQRAIGQYQVDRRARLENVLSQTDADRVFEVLSSQVDYSVAFFYDNKNAESTAAQWQALGAEQQRNIVQHLHENAGRGTGFIYGRSALSFDQGPNPLLNEVFTWLNSEPVLEWARQMSGYQDIAAASAQATRYTPGQFLTRHIDTHPSEQRRVAYVFSFTKDWHPDWGGLLQFFQSDGTPRDAWTPGFNTLSMFDVKHVHSVTYLAPYAVNPRYSITGWFRATPLS